MPRQKLIVSRTLPYHVTARTNNREDFYCSLDRVWKSLTLEAYNANLVFGAQTHAMVLMPNHFHLLVSTPHEDLGKVMHTFMGSLAKTLNRNSGRSGRPFGDKYYRTLVDTPVYFSHAFKYVYRNPVKAALIAKVEDYPYSTLSGIQGNQPLPVPIYYPYGSDHYSLIPNETTSLLYWLNQPFQKEYDRAIQKSLRKTVFAPPKGGWKRTLANLSVGLL